MIDPLDPRMARLEWVPVAGRSGWLVHHKDEHTALTYVPDPQVWVGMLAAALNAAGAGGPDPRLDEILATVRRLETMSNTMSGQLDDDAARDEAAMTKLSTDLAAIAAELKANVPPVGTQVTQAQVDRHTAIATSLEAAAAAADALVAPAPVTPAPVVFNGNQDPANSVGGRNTRALPGFDETQPETP